jgi:tetratricopeptide (TPR) repeat protein
MERNPMKTTTIVLAASLAALLLCTPPARAARTHKAAPMDSATKALLSEGLGRLQTGEYTAAISLFTKAAQRRGDASTYFLLGWAHYQRGFKNGEVASADPDDAQSALDAYGLALQADPKLSSLTSPSNLYFSRALCYEALGQFDRALDSYKAAMRTSSGKALIALNAARLRLKMKDEDKAMSNVQLAMSMARKAGREDALRSAAAHDPAFAPLLADRMLRRALGVAASEDGLMVAAADLRGEDLRDSVADTRARPAPPVQDQAVLDLIAKADQETRFRRFQTAIADYNRALSLDSARRTLTVAQTASVYEKVGAAYNKVGQSDAAVRFLRKSLQLAPRGADAAYQIALAYAQGGQTGTALQALKSSFAAASSPAELRRLVLLAKTDTELEAVRDLPAFRDAVGAVSSRIALR